MPDGRVTFRLYAPKASEVLITGEWMTAKDQPLALVKGEDSVWSATTDPLPAEIYTYRFLVDGVATADPQNYRNVVSAGRSVLSMVEVRGEAATPWDDKAVPHGTIHIESFDSKLQDRTRLFYVYTPPGYRSNSRTRFPTLVLLPGTPADESEWMTFGPVQRIFDNLIGDKKMKEMVVLMPRSDVLTHAGTRADNLKAFEPLLLQEVLPTFEERYRVDRAATSRAIIGISLGGELAFSVGFRHPETFRWLGSMSGSLVEREFAERYGKAYELPGAANSNFKLIWMGCGADDFFMADTRKLSALFKTKGVHHTLREYRGGHVMTTFRRELTDVLPLLFR